MKRQLKSVNESKELKMSQPEDLSKVLTGAQDSHDEAQGNPGYSGSAQVPDNSAAKSDSENKPKQDPATTPKTVKTMTTTQTTNL